MGNRRLESVRRAAQRNILIATRVSAIVAIGGVLLVGLLAACADTSTAPSTPPPAPAPAAAATDPQLVVDPPAGTDDASVNVHGRGWKPGEVVLIMLQDENGRSNVLAASIVDSFGAFTASFAIPDQERWLRLGPHTVVAQGDAVGEITTTFDVVPAEDLAPLAAASVPSITQSLTRTISLPVVSNATQAQQPPLNMPEPTTTISIATASTATLPTATSTPDEGASLRTRLETQGLFFAEQGPVPVLDGFFDEWTSDWHPVTVVVWGGENHTGPADLAGEFQVRWGMAGLYLAVRVQDDLLRAGPNGTDMWQGDGLEIHFDRLLDLDFADPAVNGDDYQLGVAPDVGFTTVRAYRWIPQPREAALSVPGAARVTESGYNLEVQIPWSYLDLNPADLSSGGAFGFNLSINDNDADISAQQTIASSSPARTDHETPTEWGTLILE